MKKTEIIFITGTDTAVGKTRISAALLQALRCKGVDARYFKPIQSGAVSATSDAAEVRSAAKENVQGVFPALYTFRLPASPHLAAKVAGKAISITRIVRQIHAYASTCDLLIVEGAGGLLVPITPACTMLDLIGIIEAQVILVSRNTLGTLNHTELSLRELKRAGFPPVAVILNSTTAVKSSTDRVIQKDNADLIRRMATPTPVIITKFKERLPVTGNAIIKSLGGVY